MQNKEGVLAALRIPLDPTRGAAEDGAGPRDITDQFVGKAIVTVHETATMVVKRPLDGVEADDACRELLKAFSRPFRTQ